MKYLVRDCDPNTGEPDDDGYDDEYVVRENPRAYGRPSLRPGAALKRSSSPLVCLSWRIWR